MGCGAGSGGFVRGLLRGLVPSFEDAGDVDVCA